MTLPSQIRALLPKVTKGPYEASRCWNGYIEILGDMCGGYHEIIAFSDEDDDADLITLLLNHATEIADALEAWEQRKDDRR